MALTVPRDSGVGHSRSAHGMGRYTEVCDECGAKWKRAGSTPSPPSTLGDGSLDPARCRRRALRYTVHTHDAIVGRGERLRFGCCCGQGSTA